MKNIYQLPNDYSKERFDIQVQCVDSCTSDPCNTVIAKGPAGFGKTLIGILWTFEKGDHSIWVCPRNAVATSVYENIIREFKNLNIKKSVELYLTGKRTENGLYNPSNELISEFEADIVVTNIDNLLNPLVSNRTAHRLFSILSSNVVLDEFHEFVSEVPLFAAFITYMRARHQVCSGIKTLLLSATPSTLNMLWDTDDRKTDILPNGDSHYAPIHDQAYSIKFDTSYESPKQGSFNFRNAVKLAQNYYKTYHTNHIAHSHYLKEDIDIKLANIKKSFGKKGDGVKKGESVSSAPILQAAMDISAQHLVDCLCSPEDSMQRIGRCNRWNEVIDASITFVDDTSREETTIVNILYNSTLRKLWLNFLKTSLSGKDSVTLKELYKLYNSFNQKNQDLITIYLKNKYINGTKRLTLFGPRKLRGMAENKTGKKVGGKNLRSPFGQGYFVLRNKEGNWTKSPFSEDYENLSKRAHKELAKVLTNPSTMKSLIKGLAPLYPAYERYLKKNKVPDLGVLLKLMKSPETPLPDVTRTYCPDLGYFSNT